MALDPLRFLSGHSLLNLESMAALGFLLVLMLRARPVADPGPLTPSSPSSPSSQWPVFAALCLLILVVYWRVLNAPFLYDDYTHITDSQQASWHSILAAFGPVDNPPGLFFRPFGFLVYWVNYQIAGPDPRWWHATSLAFHAIDACLVYSLCRALRLDGAAAFLFAVAGSAVEPAAWIDARFDPMATALVLVSLLCVCRFLDGGRWFWICAACLAGVAGFMSKESAFCLPLLVGCLWFFRPASERFRLAIAVASVGAVAAGVFLYRYWALGGIGGYRGPAGDSNIESFSVVRMLNAVFVRDWTILFFPVNWSGPAGLVLAMMLGLTPVVLGLCVWRARVQRRVVMGAILMTLCAALPVQHLLLIGVDLANTRYVYLLAVGWAMLWGAVFAGLRQRPVWRWVAIGWMVTLHLAIGRHNLEFWLRVPEEAREVCEDFGRALPPNTTAVVGPLPQRKNGVVFLANGFPQCVEMNGHIPPGRVSMFGTPNFVWNPESNRVEAVVQKR